MDRQQLATDNALRLLPSHGWTAGWVGRRDRALIVLSQVADLPYQRIAQLSAGDIGFAEGKAIIAGPDGDIGIPARTDSLLCAPCALARWLHALDLTVVYTDTKVIASVIGRAAPLTARSPHVCENPRPISDDTRDVPALPAIDRWGVLAPHALSTRPHPRSHLTRGAGPLAVHRPVPSQSWPAAEMDTNIAIRSGSHRADQVPGTRGRDAGAGTREIAPDVDVAGSRAVELERRLRQILDHATNLDN